VLLVAQTSILRLCRGHDISAPLSPFHKVKETKLTSKLGSSPNHEPEICHQHRYKPVLEVPIRQLQLGTQNEPRDSHVEHFSTLFVDSVYPDSYDTVTEEHDRNPIRCESPEDLLTDVYRTEMCIFPQIATRTDGISTHSVTGEQGVGSMSKLVLLSSSID